MRELGGRAEVGRVLFARIERAVAHRHAEGAERDQHDVGDDQRLAALERALDRERGGLLVERHLHRREEHRAPRGRRMSPARSLRSADVGTAYSGWRSQFGGPLGPGAPAPPGRKVEEEPGGGDHGNDEHECRVHGDDQRDDDRGEQGCKRQRFGDVLRRFVSFVLLENDGTVKIASVSGAAGREAQARIELITADVEVGRIYEGKVVRLMDFGAFVAILPGRDGLVHISQISEERVERVADKLKEGDNVRVKVLEVDRQGRVRLTMRNVDAA